MFLRILLIIAIFCAEPIFSRRIRREKKTYVPHTFSSCFEEIGCIDVTEKWYHEKWRPRNKEPLDRHTIRTEFLLMKKSKTNGSELVYDIMSLKRESVGVAEFKKGTCTIFVIHDFTSNGYTGWIKHLVLAFLRKTDCNIISVDWEAGAEPPYEQAIANARVVALEARAFITLIQTCFSQSTDNIHLIGHGVGAHIAGYIGKYIPGIQRITGLDPTGPFFVHMPKEVHLDVGDAKYVEVLHTDSFNHRSQGSKLALGHADFIINNADHQPGCNDSSHFPSFVDLHRDTLQEGKILPACSHKRSFKYYIQALEDNECQFIGIKCASYIDFLAGKCNDCKPGPKCSACATFGLEPPSCTTKNNTFYLLTNSHKPFCLISYGVNVTTAAGTTNKEEEGYFEIIIVDENDHVTNISSNINHHNTRKLESGHSYDFIFYGSPPCVNKIKEAKVKWVYKSKKLCVLCDKSLHVKQITIKRLSIRKDTKATVNVICPIDNSTLLKTDDYVEFAPCELVKAKKINEAKAMAGKGTAAVHGPNSTPIVYPFLCNASSPQPAAASSSQPIAVSSPQPAAATPTVTRRAESSTDHLDNVSISSLGGSSGMSVEAGSPVISTISARRADGPEYESAVTLQTKRRSIGTTVEPDNEADEIRKFDECFQITTTTTEECSIDRKSIAGVTPD